MCIRDSLVIAQCEQIEYFETNPKTETCACAKLIAGTSVPKSSTEHQHRLYSIDCTGQSPLVHRKYWHDAAHRWLYTHLHILSSGKQLDAAAYSEKWFVLCQNTNCRELNTRHLMWLYSDAYHVLTAFVILHSQFTRKTSLFSPRGWNSTLTRFGDRQLQSHCACKTSE